MRHGRFFSFFLTRLVIAVVVFFGVWRVGEAAWTLVLGAPSMIIDRVIATLAALVAMLVVGGLIERCSVAKLGFPTCNALRDLGLGLLLGAGVLTAIVGVMALCGWYEVIGLRTQEVAR